MNGQPHAVQATLTRSYLYPFAIFAKTSIGFNGNTGDYDPTTGIGPVETVDGAGNPVLSPEANVASNGQITCQGSLSPAHQQDYFRGGGAHSGDFAGVLYAPTAIEVNPSCDANWRGAVIVNTFTCNGGPHLSVHYDTRMLSLTEVRWNVSDYTEIPSNQVVLP